MTTQLHFIAGDDYVVYHVSSTVPGGKWHITPALPRGIEFDSSALTISGYPQSIQEVKAYNISQESTVVVSASFSLDVITCPSGFYYHVNHVGTPFLTINYHSTFLRNVTVWVPRDLCLYEDDMDVTTCCPYAITNGCTVAIYGEDELLLMRAVVNAHESSQSTLSYHSSGVPVITAPEYMVGLAKNYFALSIPISDHYYPVIIEPSSSDIQWDDIDQELRGQLPYGVHTFTMRASNEKGSSEVVLKFYINQCPSQLSYLHISRPNGNSDYLYLYDINQNLVFNSYMDGEFDQTLCLDPGRYYVNVTRGEDSGEYEMYFLDEYDDVNDMMIWNVKGDSQVQMITLGDDIPFGSSLKYLISDNPDKNWNMKKYRDKNWKEGKTGSWGLFSHSTVYFRKQFSVNDISQVSIVHVTIKGHDQVTVFLNGIQISYVDMSSRNLTSIRTTIPSDMISKGTNVICVCLTRSSSTSSTDMIDFDLKLKTIPAETLLRSLKGIANDQPVQPRDAYAAKNAFGGQYYWKSIAVPVNLTYLFTNGDQSWINQISFYGTSNSVPVDFMIQGLVTVPDKNGSYVIVQADDLVHVQDDTFLYMQDLYKVDFIPSRAYDGFRFLFYKGYNDQAIIIQRIQFYVRSNRMCKGSWGKKIRVGDSQIEKCSFKYIGYRVKHCTLDVERKPIWEIDDSMCINRYAPKGISYVDTVFTVTNLPYGWYDSLFEKINTVVTSNLTVWNDDISYPIMKYQNIYDCSREVVMRFTLEEELGDYVEKKIAPILPHLGIEAADKMDKSRVRPFTVEFDLKATYRYPFPWSIVCWIVIGVVFYLLSLVVAIFCGRLTVRSNLTSGKVPAVKRLKKSKTVKQEEERLL